MAVAEIEKKESPTLTRSTGEYTEVRRVVPNFAGCPFTAQLVGGGELREGLVEHSACGDGSVFTSTKVISVWKVRRGMINSEIPVLYEHIAACLPPADDLPWKHVGRRT